MSIKRSAFGTTRDGVAVERITMTNHSGASVSVMTYGGTLLSILVPDRHGIFGDVCLGFSDVSDYERAPGYIGALIGRYGNRIAAGHLVIDGQTYALSCNEGKNHLHGGNVGFDKKIWTAACTEREDGDSVAMRYVSADGEEQFPGKLTTVVTYTWNDENELSLHYHAVSDKKTVINLTNHAYFNLSGHNAETIENHLISINADAYTEVDAACLPTGQLPSVEGTPFDLRELTRIGKDIDADNRQLQYGKGYDHNFVLVDPEEGICKACELYDPQSGRIMETFTDLPGLQFYAGNMLSVPFEGKDHAKYAPRCGMCLETQYFPDTPNQPDFPQCFFDAEAPFEHTTVYKFGVREEE